MAADTEVWVLIAGDLEPQRMVVTWPRQGAEIDSETFARAVTGGLEALGEGFVERWESMSGVDRTDIEHWWPIIAVNEIIGPLGLAEDKIVNYIRLSMAEGLRKGR